MNASWGQAAGRSDLVRLVLHLIVEEALEGEGADALEREAMRGEGEKAGYGNGYRMGKPKTAERRWIMRHHRYARPCHKHMTYV